MFFNYDTEMIDKPLKKKNNKWKFEIVLLPTNSLSVWYLIHFTLKRKNRESVSFPFSFIKDWNLNLFCWFQQQCHIELLWLVYEFSFNQRKLLKNVIGEYGLHVNCKRNRNYVLTKILIHFNITISPVSGFLFFGKFWSWLVLFLGLSIG